MVLLLVMMRMVMLTGPLPFWLKQFCKKKTLLMLMVSLPAVKTQ